MNAGFLLTLIISLIIAVLSSIASAQPQPPQTCSTTAPPLSKALTLKYWNGRGLMEIARMVLAIGGKFPNEDYVDGKYSAPADGLDSNLGRMPVATVGHAEEEGKGDDEQSVGQSLAIYYYVASEMGLMGDSSLEAAQVLSVAEHLRELKASFTGLVVPAGAQPTKEQADTWFDGGAEDVSGTADKNRRTERYLTWYLGRIEQSLGTSSQAPGFAVGSRLSLADVMLYYAFAEELKVGEIAPGADIPQWKREPFGDKQRMEAALIKHPRIAASVEAVRSNSNFQHYLAMRGEQEF